MYRQQTWRGNWESMGGAAQLRRRSSICVFVFPLSRRCHTTLGTLFRSHPLAPGSFLTILCADVVAHATPFTSLTLPPTSLFSSALGACGLQDCGMQSRPRLSPSTFACLSPNVQLNFSLCSILFSVEYLSYRTISQFHALHVEHRQNSVLESLGNERIKHRHRKCSCGPGLRRLYLPYAASAGRLTFSRCPKIAKSDLEGYSFQVANCERNH